MEQAMEKLFAARLHRIIVLLVLAVSCGAAAAHNLTPVECREGGDFVKNAALSRDFGVAREVFLDRMESDLLAIRQYPPHLRWFAQDEEDEALLLQAVRNVFDAPRDPPSHQVEFLARCAASAGT
jgi:hypothetical protein